LHTLTAAAGLELVFNAGLGSREQSVLAEFRRLAPAATVLPRHPELSAFLAIVKRARAFVSGDTGPLHFAAALGVPTLALFGPTSAVQWRPLGERHRVLGGGPCGCSGDTAVCRSPIHCLSLISPAQVFEGLRELVARWQKDCFTGKTVENVSDLGK
jgi:ADP-heptose:LPS heptosyltransferase